MKKKKKVREVNFLLETKHYKRLHLILYLITTAIISIIYFISILIFSQYFRFIVTTIFSFVLGLYLLMNRNRIVIGISDYLEKRKREEYKKKSKENLHKTIHKRIVPKNKKIKLNIKGKLTLKEKIKNFKTKLSPKRKDRDYIEIE